MSLLEQGALETPKPGDEVFAGHEVHMIATPQQSLEAAAEEARAAGLEAYILSDEMEGESREVGKVHGGAGAGGRAAQPAVSQALRDPLRRGNHRHGEEAARGHAQRPGRPGRRVLPGPGPGAARPGRVWALAADTDGIDGMEDNAGALVAPETLSRAMSLGMKIDQYLDRNDAYGYFRMLDDLVITGPTHTNVNDFRAILVL